MIQLTERAAEKIQEFAAADEQVDGLRVRVVGGGCSGLQYKIALDSERKGDKIFESEGARLLIDRRSFLYLNGTEVDYNDGLSNAGFQLANPNVKSSCGCGESFVV